MKRKITYGLLTFILFGGLYFGLRSGFGFFTPYNALTARQDIKNGKIQIIAIGLPYMPQARQELAKHYGFQYNYVGCNATTELLNGTEYYNSVVDEYLTDKFGQDFWTKFNQQLKNNEIKFIMTESFTDTTKIGHPQNNKLELFKYVAENDSKSYVLIQLYQKENQSWKLTYKDTVNANGLPRLSPEIRDFNTDQFNDLKFCAETGANLANTINVVMLYSDQAKKLRKVGRGWNLTYSKKLKMFRERYIASTITASYYSVQENNLSKIFDIDLGPTSESLKEYDESGKIITTMKTSMDTVSYKMPKINHWLRKVTVEDSID